MSWSVPSPASSWMEMWSRPESARRWPCSPSASPRRLTPPAASGWPASEQSTLLCARSILQPRILAYLEGRRAEVTIAELFDHARRGRVDVVFFGAAEVDAEGATNMSAGGSLSAPSPKFPGVAGAASLRRWTRRPVLVMPRHSRRCLVPTVQVRSTRDERRTPLLTDLGRFEVGPGGATLQARHTGVDLDELDSLTGFSFGRASPLAVTPPPDPVSLAALAALDPARLRDSLVPERRCSP